MEILAAFDLVGSLRAAADLAGCSHHTVARLVAERDAGGDDPPRVCRPRLIDEFLPKVEEWVELSNGKIRADKAHDKLVAMGFTGSERSSRRAVAQVKKQYRLGNARVHRPWVTEPGLWLQYDFGDGPVIEGRKTVLFCAWLAWSRFRIVIALRDRTIPTVFAALDASFRLLGGAPTYVLTDNEKSVTIEHVARIPVRNQQVVAFARYYGVTVHTCEVRDPASKGGVENTVKLAKADIVPTETNLADQYDIVRRPRGGLPGVHDDRQRAGAPDHAAGPGGHAGTGTGPVASGPGAAAHGHVRGNPDSGGEHPDGVVSGRVVFGAAPTAR